MTSHVLPAPRRLARRLTALAAASVLAFGAAAPMGVAAQSAPSALTAAGVQSAVPMGGAPQPVSIARGASFAVDLPTDARDVIIADPRVAEAMLHNSRRITIIGVGPGQTDAVFLDAAGRPILSLKVRVDAGVSALQDTINRIAPGSQVTAEAINDSVVLTGLVTSPAEADRIVRVAGAFVSAPEKVLNMISVAGSDQVTLKVRVIEVQRNAIKQLGFDSEAVFGQGAQSISFGRANTYGVNGSALGGGGVCYGENRGRTTNFTNSNNTSGSSSTNLINGSRTTDLGTALTTSDGRTLTFNNATPGTLVVTNANGTTATLSGDAAADYLRNTVTAGNAVGLVQLGSALSLAAASPATASVSALNNLVQTVAGIGSGNALGNASQNLVSQAFQTVTGTNANACFQAFERAGLARTLAEPNLTSVNGESASFLAGGEFPVPTGRDRDGNVTVEYKPYGVSLAFRPVVLTGGRISLQVKVEVSELTSQGGFTLGAGTASALTIQGLQVRRSENTVELPSGGAMMIAGLLQESTRQAVDSLPGAGTVPVLGSLFRSRDYLSGETELVVIVEPYLVTATSPGRMQTPADGLRIATDIQTTLFGQLNQTYGTPSPTGANGAGWQGPVGYVID